MEYYSKLQGIWNPRWWLAWALRTKVYCACGTPAGEAGMRYTSVKMQAEPGFSFLEQGASNGITY